MHIGIVIDSINCGPTSIKNYVINFVSELLKVTEGRTDIQITLIGGIENKSIIYKKKEVNQIIIPFLQKRTSSLLLSKIIFAIKKRINQPLRNYKILKVCKDKNIDILHIPHLGRPAPSLLFLFKEKKMKLVVTNHGMANLVLSNNPHCPDLSSIKKKYPYYLEALKWKLIFRNKIDKIITVSNSEKKNIIKYLKIREKKVEVIYHGISKKYFKLLDLKNRNEKYNYVLHISVYQSKKNIERTIEAFAYLKKKYLIKEKYFIVGNNVEILKKLVISLGIEKEVLFLDFVENEKLLELYNSATCFLFPSYHESFGMPIIEAMACGCPVITSNNYACREIAYDAALLVDPYNTNELINAMYKLINNNELRKYYKDKGLKRSNDFNWEKCARKHLKLYFEVFRK